MHARNDLEDSSDNLTVVGRSGTLSPAATDVEEQPLLPGKGQPTPLPVFQLAILCFVRLPEPIAYTQIFPYVNQMVEELGVTDKTSDIGFYSGLVDSLFAFAQLFTIYQWGRLSDRIGRRPVIITGLSGVAMASFWFGLSKTFTQMVLSRAFAGLLSGNAAVVQSVFGEITDETNQAKAFPLTGAFWCIGAVIGPLIGGTLSHPAERYPSIFGQSEFLKDRPFFLPCFVSSFITCLSIITAFLFLEETLPSKVLAKKLQAVAEQTNDESDSESSYGAITPVKPPRMALSPSKKAATGSTLDLLFDERVRGVLTAGFLLSFICVAYETVWVLWAYTPISLGGIARTPSEIGYVLAATGVLGIGLSLFAYPALNTRFGTLRLYTYTMSLWSLIYILIPIMALLTPVMTKYPLRMSIMVWSGLLVTSSIGRLAGMSFSGNMIMVKSSAPNQESLGATFGLAQSVACVARASAPAFVSSLFAISIDRQILHGHFVWIVMLLISFVGIWATTNLRERS